MTVKMTPGERSATEAYLADLLAEFQGASDALHAARASHDDEAAVKASFDVRRVYKEIQEVEHVLKTGVLPF